MSNTARAPSRTRLIRSLPLAATWIALVSCADPLAEVRTVEGDLGAQLAFSTFLGERPATLRTAGFDAEGNVIVAGGTDGGSWPGREQRLGAGGDWDVTVAKFAPDGTLLWGRVFGGPDEDYAYVSAVNPDGDIVIGGRAGIGFPVTAGSADSEFGGGVAGRVHGATDGFLMRLSPDGELRWATYIGGSGNENTRAIQWLDDGAIAVGSGNSLSRDLPTDVGTLPGPVFKPQAGGELEGWVGVVAADGASFDFLSYFGPDDEAGRRDDTVRALAEDANGDLWIGGTSRGRAMTPTPNAFQADRTDAPGDSSAWVAKLSRDGRRLLYFSWLGGAGDDEIETEGASDSQGRFYVAGSTSSSDFPVTVGAYQAPPTNSRDGWVARIDADGALGFSVRYGGDGNDGFYGPGIAPDGSVVTGARIRSAAAPTSPDALMRRRGGKQDGGFAVFGPSGEFRYASHFGGADYDSTRFANFSPDGARIVLVGGSASSDFPLKDATQTRSGGAYVAVFDLVRPIEGE